MKANVLCAGYNNQRVELKNFGKNSRHFPLLSSIRMSWRELYGFGHLRNPMMCKAVSNLFEKCGLVLGTLIDTRSAARYISPFLRQLMRQRRSTGILDLRVAVSFYHTDAMPSTTRRIPVHVHVEKQGIPVPVTGICSLPY